MPVDGASLATTAAGALFLYAGIKGKSVLASFQSVLTGKSPSTVTAANTISGGTAAGPVTIPGGSASGDAIVNAALKYRGTGYVWGGKADKPGDWDCSSFVSYVLGHDLGLSLPGGGTFGSPGYPPNSHGPISAQYMLYGQSVPFGSEQPGDLLVTVVHMGICIGNGQMISAQDVALGTGIAGYKSGFPGGQPVVRRVA